MSEREFERYLRLLGELLELDEAQRASVRDELRDHMEERLADLVDKGFEREEAIQIALDEFGDAAGLAGALTRVGRAKIIRRRIMQTSIGTLAAAATLVLGLTFLLPENRPGVPTVPQSHAEGEAGVNEYRGPGGGGAAVRVTDENVGPGGLAAEAAGPGKAEQALRKTLDVDFTQRPLEEVFAWLREETGANIFVNWRVLIGQGVEREHPVTLQLHQVTAETVLELVLTSLAEADVVGYVVRDNVVRIGKAEPAVPEVRVYDVRDVLNPTAQRATHSGVSGMMSPGNGHDPYARGMGESSGYPETSSGRRSSSRGYDPGQYMPAPETPAAAARDRAEFVSLLEAQLSHIQPIPQVHIYDGLLFVQGPREAHDHVQRVLELVREARVERGDHSRARMPQPHPSLHGRSQPHDPDRLMTVTRQHLADLREKADDISGQLRRLNESRGQGRAQNAQRERDEAVLRVEIAMVERQIRVLQSLLESRETAQQLAKAEARLAALQNTEAELRTDPPRGIEADVLQAELKMIEQQTEQIQAIIEQLEQQQVGDRARGYGAPPAQAPAPGAAPPGGSGFPGGGGTSPAPGPGPAGGGGAPPAIDH